VPKFSRAQRLVHKPQFDAVYQKGRKFGDAYFMVLAKSSGKPSAGLGLSVSSRSVGNAVNRNRIKRIIRDSFRLNCADLPPVDIVVNTRSGARNATNDELRNSLTQHWNNVVKRCGAH
jgi:ribonuclease P protein component